MSRAACTCDTYKVSAPDGSTLTGELRRDPDCRRHGFPTTGFPTWSHGWPSGHPLRRHAQQVVLREAYQPRDYHTGRFCKKVPARTRPETPRETEARLYAESLRSAA